ncbi:MAG: hypothetical protein AAF598_15075 [Bacteroidota bacterium]
MSPFLLLSVFIEHEGPEFSELLLNRMFLAFSIFFFLILIKAISESVDQETVKELRKK